MIPKVGNTSRINENTPLISPKENTKTNIPIEIGIKILSNLSTHEALKSRVLNKEYKKYSEEEAKAKESQYNLNIREGLKSATKLTEFNSLGIINGIGKGARNNLLHKSFVVISSIPFLLQKTNLLDLKGSACILSAMLVSLITLGIMIGISTSIGVTLPAIPILISIGGFCFFINLIILSTIFKGREIYYCAKEILNHCKTEFNEIDNYFYNEIIHKSISTAFILTKLNPKISNKLMLTNIDRVIRKNLRGSFLDANIVIKEIVNSKAIETIMKYASNSNLSFNIVEASKELGNVSNKFKVLKHMETLIDLEEKKLSKYIDSLQKKYCSKR